MSGLTIGFIVVFIISSFLYSYWESIPYARYKTGEDINAFPFGGSSMTVNGFSTAPDITFPQSSTDIYVNITIRRSENINQNAFPETSSNKHLILDFQTANGHGELSAWNDSFGIPFSALSSVTTNQSVDTSIRFVTGNGNYNSFQLICRADGYMKPLFVVDLQNSK